MNHTVSSWVLVSLASIIALVSPAVAPDEPKSAQTDSADEKSVIALLTQMEEERVQAGVRKDVDAVAAATAEDYLQIDLDGIVRNKREAMQRIQSSLIRLQSNRLDQMVVRVFGDTAVVTARSTPTGTIDGKDFPPIRYSRVYVRHDGRWQVVMFQMTRIAASTTQ